MQSISFPVDVTDFHFKLQSKLAIFENSNQQKASDFLRLGHHLIQVSHNFGVIFIACPDSTIQIIPTNAVNESKSKSICDNDYRCKVIKLEASPIYLSLNCTGELLVVVLQAAAQYIVLFDTKAVLQVQNPQPIKKIEITNTAGVQLCDLSWNPSITNILTYCLTDGTFSLLEFANDFNFSAKRLNSSAKAQCICWSPKGKQIVMGTSVGVLVQYKPDLTAVKTVPVPPMFQNKHVKAVSLLWLSTNQYLVAYQDVNNIGTNHICIINTLKNEPVAYYNYDDICYSSGFERPQIFHFLTHFNWNVILVASSNAFEVAVLGKQNDKEPFSWQQWCLLDDSKAELPITKDGVQTKILGITMDFSTTFQIEWGENTSLPPMPVLHMLASDGTLLSFNMVNLKPNVPQICAPPQPISNEQQVFSKKSMLNPVISTPQKQPPLQTNVTKPQPQQQPQQSQVITPKPVVSVASQPQQPKPQQDVQSRLETGSNIIPEQTVNLGRHDQAFIKKLIDDEIVQFNNEINDLKRECLIQLDSLNVSDVISSLENLTTLADHLKKVTTSQTMEIHDLKQNLLQSFAWFEDAKSRNNHLQDPIFSILVKASELDPMSEKQMINIENLSNYVENQLEQVKKFLDNQWYEHEKKQKSGYLLALEENSIADKKDKTVWASRSQQLTLKEVYQTIVNMNQIIAKHSLKIKECKLQMFSKKKSLTDPTKRSSNYLQRIDRPKQSELSRELEKLKLEPIKTLIDLKIEEAKNRRKRLSNKKMDQLNELFDNQKVMKTSIKEKDRSQASITSILLSSFRNYANNSALNETNLIDISTTMSSSFLNQQKTDEFVDKKVTTVLPKSSSSIGNIAEMSFNTSTPSSLKVNTGSVPTTSAPMTSPFSFTENIQSSTAGSKMSFTANSQNKVTFNLSSTITPLNFNKNSNFSFSTTAKTPENPNFSFKTPAKTPENSNFSFITPAKTPENTNFSIETVATPLFKSNSNDKQTSSLVITPVSAVPASKESIVKPISSTVQNVTVFAQPNEMKFTSPLFKLSGPSPAPLNFATPKVKSPEPSITVSTATLKSPTPAIIMATSTTPVASTTLSVQKEQPSLIPINFVTPEIKPIITTTPSSSSVVTSLFQGSAKNEKNSVSVENSSALNLSGFGTISESTATTSSKTPTSSFQYTSTTTPVSPFSPTNLVKPTVSANTAATQSPLLIAALTPTSTAVPVTTASSVTSTTVTSPTGNSFNLSNLNFSDVSPFELNKSPVFGISSTTTVTTSTPSSISATTTSVTTLTPTSSTGINNSPNLFMGQQICSPFSIEPKNTSQQPPQLQQQSQPQPQPQPQIANLFGTPTVGSTAPQVQQQQQQPASTGNVFGTSNMFGSPASPNQLSSGFSFMQVGPKPAATSPFSQTPSTTQTNAFGQNTLTQSVGFGQQTNLFGSNSSSNSFGTASVFGTPQNQTLQPSVFGNTTPMFGSGCGFGTPAQKPQSVFGGGGGSGSLNQSPGAFGAPPVFGSGVSPVMGGGSFLGQNSSNNSSFGSAPVFGGGPKVFGSPQNTNVFGASATQNSNFANIANQPTLGFGTLAQQGGQENKPLQPTTAFTNSSSFSSWR